MGCDFYIYIHLEIEHLGGVFYIEIPVKRGYYGELTGGYYDDDFEDYEHIKEEYQKLYLEMIKLDLTPYPPVVIYENDAFISSHFEQKYREIIERELKNNAILNLKYNKNNDDEDNNDEDDKDSVFFKKRHEDIGIPPENFCEILKITRKEERVRPSLFWDSDSHNE